MYVEIETITCSIEEPNAVQVYCGSNPIAGEEVELGGRVWYPVKACHMSDNLSVETICCLAPFSSYTRCTSLTRGSSPILGETVEVGDRVWSFMKAYHIRPRMCLLKPLRYPATFTSKYASVAIPAMQWTPLVTAADVSRNKDIPMLVSCTGGVERSALQTSFELNLGSQPHILRKGMELMGSNVVSSESPPYYA